MEKDLEGETRVYLVKDQNSSIALFFSIKCGLLYKKYQYDDLESDKLDFVNMLVDAMLQKDNDTLSNYYNSGMYDLKEMEYLFKIASHRIDLKMEDKELQDNKYSINEDNLKQYYWVIGKNKQDPYLVAMQLLLENYCHFLCTNNVRGNIVYEYRELIGNEKLRNKYYHMKLMGSMYMTKEAAEKRLLGIDFIDKSNNEAGLQIADFIPNSFARDHAGISQSNPNIFGTLRYNLYDGTMGNRDRFGIKYMP